ncbi:MAG: hypothetical protein AABW53_02850 [Nanoarchaeota archaeon]
MSKIILLFVAMLLIPFALAQEVENDCIYYFYGQECEDCTAAEATVFGLEQSYPHLQMQRYEVYHNFQNFELLQQYYAAYGIEKKSRSIPAVFMKGNYLVGSKAITSLLEERVKDNSDPNCPSLSPEQQAVGILGEGETPNILSTLNFSLITGDALRNMFAPGMVALMLLFLAILSATKSKEEIIKASTYYIAGIFIAYLLFGLGMFSSFYDSQLHYLFYKSVGIAAMLFGLAGVQSFFTTWELVMPHDLRNYVKQVLAYVLSPAGILIIGLLGAIFTLAGVGSSFYLLRDLFAGDFMRSIVFPLMLYYSAAAMLIFIGVAVLFNLLSSLLKHAVEGKEGSSDMKRQRWKKHYEKVLSFCVRGTILVLGSVLVFM